MNWRVLETLAWATLYVGFAVFALSVRHVSPTYRAVYLDRTASDWLPGADIAYVPGTHIDGGAPSPYFGPGWWWPDGDGRWGSGESTIVVRPSVDLPAGSLLSGRIGAFLGRIPATTLHISVNGHAVGDVPITSAGELVDIALPLPVSLPAGRQAKIVFSDPNPASPFTAYGSPEVHEWGVRLVDLVLTPPGQELSAAR